MTPLVLDVNIMLSAHRRDHGSYAAVRPWFDELLAGDRTFAVPSMVWASFVRLAINRKVFVDPTPLERVFAFVGGVTAQPHHLHLEPGPRHLTLLRGLCTEGAVSSDLVPDAALAAIAAEHGCTVATVDRDFARFPSVEHVLLRT